MSLLAKYRSDGRIQPPPPPVDVDEDGELFEIEKVLQHRDVKRGKRTVRQYLIKWLGYGPEHNQWEPEVNLTKSALDSYWATMPAGESDQHC